MKINPEQASHLIYLIDWVRRTNGPVVELGIGFGSTPILHELCRDRKLVSYENKPRFFAEFARYASPWHEMKFVESWDKAELECPWSVAFVDSWPGPSRPELIKRLRPWADYLIIHDTEKRHDRYYHMKDLIRTFRYRVTYKAWEPYTSVVSDRCPL